MRDEWSSAAVQFVGTVLFNVSTAAAVWAHAASDERRYVWAPDAAGSLAFLASGVIGMTAVAGARTLRRRQWWAAAVNLIGCIAFAVSAVAAHVSRAGMIADQRLANVGTFVGALCFLAAALIVMPRRTDEQPAAGPSVH